MLSFNPMFDDEEYPAPGPGAANTLPPVQASNYVEPVQQDYGDYGEPQVRVASDPDDPETLAHAAREAVINTTAQAQKSIAEGQSLNARAQRAQELMRTDPTAVNQGAQADAERGFGAAFQALAPTRVTAPRQGYGATKAYTDQAAPLVGEQPQLLAGQQDAELEHAALEAGLTKRIADEQNAAMIEQRASELALAEREDAQIERTRLAMDDAKRATEEFKKANVIDPSRAWAKKGLGMKIIAALGAAFGGGDISHITGVIDREVAAQRANAEIAMTQVHKANARVDEEQSLYKQILIRTGNQREADAIWTLSRLQAVQGQAAALLQASGVKQLSHTQALAMNGLQQAVNAQMFKVNKLAAANTPYVTRIVQPKGPQADLAAYAGKKAVDAKFAAGGRQVDIAMDHQKGQQALELERVKQSGKPVQEAADGRVRFNMTTHLAEKTGESRNRLRLINNFRHEFGADIPGTSWASWFDVAKGSRRLSSEQTRRARSQLKRIAISRLREETGAAYSEQEYEDVAENYLSALGEADVFAELDAQEGADVQRVREATRAVVAAGPMGIESATAFYGGDPRPFIKTDMSGLMTQRDAADDVDWNAAGVFGQFMAELQSRPPSRAPARAGGSRGSGGTVDWGDEE